MSYLCLKLKNINNKKEVKQMIKVMTIFGTRPEAIKMAPLVKELEKTYDNMFRSKNSSSYKAYLDEVEVINGISVLVKRVDNVNIDVLKDIIDKVSAELGKSVVFFADVMDGGKIIFVAKAKENAANCGMLVKNAAIITGGNGGGRPDFAQAGGKDASKVDEALKAVKDAIK